MSQEPPALGNYVVFVDGVPKRLHCVSSAYVDRELRDSVTGRMKHLNVLELHIDMEDGAAVSSTWSITASGAADQVAPYLDPRILPNYDFQVTQRGSGFARRFTVEALPRV